MCESGTMRHCTDQNSSPMLADYPQKPRQLICLPYFGPNVGPMPLTLVSIPTARQARTFTIFEQSCFISRRSPSARTLSVCCFLMSGGSLFGVYSAEFAQLDGSFLSSNFKRSEAFSCSFSFYPLYSLAFALWMSRLVYLVRQFSNILHFPSS
jgi:hypothetical protein